MENPYEHHGPANTIDKATREKLVEKKRELVDALPEARTLQELMWLVEAAAVDGKVLSDNDSLELEPASTLLHELEYIESKEESGNPESQLYIRGIRALFRRVLEIRSIRAELNSIYKEEITARVAPKQDEFFAVRVINREKFDQKATPHLEPPIDSTPIMIAPGFSVGAEALRRNAIGIAEYDRSVATFVVPPSNTWFDTTIKFPLNTPTLTKIHATLLLKAIDVCNKKTFGTGKKFDVLAYSQGAINTLTAAMAEPEKFRKIVLVNPAGLTNLDASYLSRFATLLKNSAKHHDQVLTEAKLKPEPLRNRLSREGLERYLERYVDRLFDGNGEEEKFGRKRVFYNEFSQEMREIGKRGGLKAAVKTADAISRTNLIPMIQHLTGLGIKIAILPAEDDPLFPVGEIEAAGKHAGVDVYPAVGAHANVGFSPGAMAALYISCFDNMDNEPSRENNPEANQSLRDASVA